MRPSWTPMSRPVRPSGRLAFRTIKSKVMDGPRLSLALEIRDHQCLRIVGPAGDGDQSGDRKEIGQHEKNLAGHDGAEAVLEPELEGVEGPKEERAEERLAGA